MVASEALPYITSVSQLCTRTLKKRNERRKLEDKNRWRKKVKKTMRRRARTWKESRNCYLIFFIPHDKMVKKRWNGKGKKRQPMGVEQIT